MSESEFIKKSQHAEMTRAVQSHFDAGSGPAAVIAKTAAKAAVCQGMPVARAIR